MVFLAKLMYSLFTPPGIFIVIIALLTIGILYNKQKSKLMILVLCLLALVMYITSVPFFATKINSVIDHVYQRQLPPKNAMAVIVVLAGGLTLDENGIPFQPSMITIERLYAAVKLSKERPSYAFLIMSGGDTFNHYPISAAEVMKDAAYTMGCSAQIILEEKSRNTDENLKYCAEIIKELNVKHVVIVTSNSHMERAMNFAHQYMPDDVKVYAYPSGGYRDEREMRAEMFLPSIRALSASCD